MPRPKRTKIAPSAPAPRIRKAEPTSKIHAQKQPAERPFDEMDDVRDLDDRAVMSARRVQKTNGKGKAANLAREEGTLGMKATPARITAHRRVPSQEEIGNALGGQFNIAAIESIELGSSSPAIEVGRKDVNTPVVENSALANFKTRPPQPSILGRGAGRARSSSVESILADTDGLAGMGKKNTSTLGTFKRCAQQQSILGRKITDVRASSVGLEMGRGTPAVASAYKIGNFRRRERQPSILGTAQKVRPTQPEFDDEEDDFNPEDESTPVNFSKTRDLTSSSSSNPRKRKLSAVQVPRSRESSLILPSLQGEEETIQATGPLSDEDELGSPSQQESPMISITARPKTPEFMNETMAPPRSSSPSHQSPEDIRSSLRISTQPSSTRGRRTFRGKTPSPATQDSPISSPPSLTHSPNRPAIATKQKAQRQPKRPATFSTVQLRNLLPRRRRRQVRDIFDIASSEGEIDVSGLASDDDELSHLAVRALCPRLTRTPAPLRKLAKTKSGPKPTSKNSSKRTYGRLTTSDKENENTDKEVIDPDDSLAPIRDDEDNGSPENSQELEKRVGKELKKAARKFEEVDKWELEFEDVTASSSSPKGAR
ncbi:hypothetical protein B7494_g3934 [Chlorociboria aeruginascens]|nr:hypothetical protein B7494_g3934 [Chlorociboria aeruginascens]